MKGAAEELYHKQQVIQEALEVGNASQVASRHGLTARCYPVGFANPSKQIGQRLLRKPRK